MKSENFVKAITEIKEKNELDLSAGEDLSIALITSPDFGIINCFK